MTQNNCSASPETLAMASCPEQEWCGLYDWDTALEFQSKGDPFADLFEDLAAEQKAHTIYNNLLRVIEDPDVRAPLKFLRAREIVHFQHFGETLEMTKSNLNNFYYFNAEFDKKFYKPEEHR